MENFVLSCCSTADLTPERLRERNIPWVKYRFWLDETEYRDSMGEEMTPEELYAAIASGKRIRTSQVSPGGYREFFENFLSQGKDILHIAMSSGISGGYNSAMIAATELRERYPERKLYVLDSLAASSGFGMLTEELADMRDEGKSIDEVFARGEARKRSIHHWFYSSDLQYYVKGGRITKTAGWVGTVLKICPVMWVNGEGKLIPRVKARGKENAAAELVRMMEAHCENGTDYSGRCYVSNAGCPEEGAAVKKRIAERFPKAKIEEFGIGATIGCHTGPGTVAIFFLGDTRE